MAYSHAYQSHLQSKGNSVRDGNAGHFEGQFHHSESDTQVFYRFRPAKDDRRYLVVVLSGFRDPVHSVDFVGGAESIRANVLWIYDDFDGVPGYYYWGKNVRDLSLPVHLTIDDIRRKLGIPQTSVVLLGLSKGANAALLFAAEYGYSKIVASAPRAFNGTSMMNYHNDVFEHIRNGKSDANALAEKLDSELPVRVESDDDLEKSIFVLTSPADEDRYLTESVALSNLLSKYSNFQMIHTRSDLVFNHIQVSKYNLSLYISIIVMFTEGLVPTFIGPEVQDDEFIHSGGDLSKAIGNGALNNSSINGPVDPGLLAVESGALESRVLKVALSQSAVLRISGYAIKRGVPFRRHGLTKLKLVMVPMDTDQEVVWAPLGSIKDSALSARLYSGELVDYSFGGFATLQERGIKLSNVPIGQYYIQLQMSTTNEELPMEVKLSAPPHSKWVLACDKLIGLDSDSNGWRINSRPLIAKARGDVYFDLTEFSVRGLTLFIEGYFIPAGVTLDRWDSIAYYLVLERAQLDGSYEISQSYYLANGNRKNAGSLCGEPWRDQSKAYFATRYYRGISISSLLPGTYRVTITARCGDDVFSRRLDRRLIVNDVGSSESVWLPSVSLIGSCVSTDNFNSRLSPDWKSYWARGPVFYQSSLVSLMADPVALPYSMFQDLDRHSFDVTAADFSKGFLNDQREFAPNVLIVDLFADVRFGVVGVGDSWITHNEWKVARSVDFKRLRPGRRVDMIDDSTHYISLFEDSCIRFAEYMRAYLPDTRIVLNRARNVDLHRELSAQGGRFSRDLVAKWNKAWATLDRIFAHYSGATILDPMDDDLQGATSHAWGPGPVHYESDYYDRFHSLLFEALGRKTEVESI